MDPKQLYNWCRIPGSELAHHPGLKARLRVVRDSRDMGELMARELVEVIEENNRRGRPTRAIIPCGPTCWYKPYTELVNTRAVSLANLFVFHMDECLDWQGRLLPRNHPYNFRTYMERHFYGGIQPKLAVPEAQRFWLTPASAQKVGDAIAQAPIDITVGGWGQDGHVAYNQARRNPYSQVTIEDVANSTIRIQENNPDTILALAQRTFGTAYQFVPPMSITLGVGDCLSAVRVGAIAAPGGWTRPPLGCALS